MMKQKKVKWPVEKLFNRKLKHKVNIWIKALQIKEKFKENELEPLQEEV